jgi:hypothetical protein
MTKNESKRAQEALERVAKLIRLATMIAIRLPELTTKRFSDKILEITKEEFVREGGQPEDFLKEE